VYLKENDTVYNVTSLKPVMDECTQEGLSQSGKTGDIWFSRSRMPHREVGIRAIGESFPIMDNSGKVSVN